MRSPVPNIEYGARIGLTDSIQEGVFTWLSGEAVAFTKWNSGQPDNLNRWGVQNADFAFMSSDGTWQDEQDSSTLPAILELPGIVSQSTLDAAIGQLAPKAAAASTTNKNNAFLSKYWDPNVNHWMRVFPPYQQPRTNYYGIAGNYWGTLSTVLIDAAISDFNDDIGKGNVVYQPILTTPPTTTFPFVVDVALTNNAGQRVSRVGAETVTFTVTYNRDMNTAVAPAVSFGPDTPMTDYTVHPVNGGWQNPRTWAGNFNVNSITGDGYQLIRLAKAVAADDPWLVTGNDEARFRFEIITSGVEALTLQANGGEGKVNLSWTQTDFELLAGYNLYRSTSETGSYTRINSSIIPAQTKQFTDVNVQPGQPYYYKFTVVQTHMSESAPSNIAQATPRDTIPPVIAHTPLTQAEPSLSLSVVADITDNVAVTGATLFYRTQGQTTYQSRAMVKVTGNRWTVALEGTLIASPGVEYYLSATDGVSTTLAGRPEQPYLIVVQDKPVITGVSPAQAGIAGGTVVTISGSNFKTGTKVYFGSLLATEIVVVSSSQITCKVPVSIPSRVSVRVEGANGAFTTLVNAFTFIDTNPTLYLPDKSTFAGAIVTVPLDLANANGLVSADITVTYAPAILRIRTATAGALATGWSLVSNTATSGQVRLSMAAGSGSVTGSGTLANLEFDVIGSASQNGALTISVARLNDGAITATLVNGSVVINVGYAMSGRVYYWSDSSRNVAGTTLTLEGSGTQTATAAANGTYAFANLQNIAYGLTPTKTTQVESISAYDAALVLQHAAGLTTLTGNAAKAADVNLTGEVTAMDAYHILRQASAVEAITVPGAGRAWLFTPATRTYAALTANQTGQDFTAVLLGDVSGNWQSTNGQSGATVKTGLATVTDTAANRTTVYLLLQAGTVPIYGIDVVLTYGVGQTLTAGETEPGISNSINGATAGTLRAALAKAEGLTGNHILLAATFSGTSDPQVAVQSIAMNEGAVLSAGTVEVAAFDNDGDGRVDPLGAPVIKTQPQSQSAAGGASVTFSIVAAGNPSLSYQWRKNTTPISGATTATLALSNVGLADAATYSVVVSNTAGSVPSTGATLTLLGSPTITTQPQPVNPEVIAGNSVSFTVAAAGNPAPGYLWRRNGTPISGATHATYAIANVQPAHAGAYSVVASNTQGSVTSNATTLTVLVPPSITTQPTPPSRQVNAGASASYTVTAAGTPTLTYQWKRNDAAIAGATTATISLVGVQAADAGTYKVTVANGAGSITSDGVILLVVPPGVSAAHATTATGYVAGGTLSVTNTLNYTGVPSALGWQVLLPSGVSLFSDTATTAHTRPAAGTTGLLEWSWTTMPNSPVVFSYVLTMPATLAGTLQVAALGVARLEGMPAALQLLAQPDPLALPPIAPHYADSNKDWTISLLELTRVIELYNVRNGTVRTGCYTNAAGPTEDGFAPDPTRVGSAAVTLSPYHHADSNRDGKIGLIELTRVIELYNTRSGTTRTGAYHVQAGTEDGFAPGP